MVEPQERSQNTGRTYLGTKPLELAENEASNLQAQVQRVEAWAHEQGRPFPDGEQDREGEAVEAGCRAALAGNTEALVPSQESDDCSVVNVDGEAVLVRGPLTLEVDRQMFAQVVRAAKRKVEEDRRAAKGAGY